MHVTTPLAAQTVLRTKDLADAAGIGVQQVRNYEVEGFIPAAERSPNGYRRYTLRHREAIVTARVMIAGYGWQSARMILQAYHQGNLAVALAGIDTCHARLATSRSQVERAQHMLMTITDHQPALMDRHWTRGLSVGAAAQQVGVRVSALRHWEQQGLLHPSRDPHSGYRQYDGQQLQRLQIIVLLRSLGYDQHAIRPVLDELSAGRVAQALEAVEQRMQALYTASRAALAAAAAFWTYSTEEAHRVPAVE